MKIGIIWAAAVGAACAVATIMRGCTCEAGNLKISAAVNPHRMHCCRGDRREDPSIGA
jgi:hypothetical protein